MNIITFKVSDKENEMIVEARDSFEALQQFVIYNYGGVIYKGDVKIEIIKE